MTSGMRSLSPARLAFTLLLGAGSADALQLGVSSAEMAPEVVTCSAAADCHPARTGVVETTLTGPSVMSSGQICRFAIAIDGALQAGAGVFVRAFFDSLPTTLDDGVLVSLESNTRITDRGGETAGELTHIFAPLPPPTGSFGIFDYTFAVHAPDLPGVLDLVAAMNSFDGFGTSANDDWDDTSAAVDVVAEPLPGDANCDGVVNGADYTVWADHFGMANPLGSADGDFNGDGGVDGGDYTLWADNFGATRGGAAAGPAPEQVHPACGLGFEPTALLLLLRARRSKPRSNPA